MKNHLRYEEYKMKRGERIRDYQCLELECVCSDDNEGDIRVCSFEEADYYSVYGRDFEDRAVCLADFYSPYESALYASEAMADFFNCQLINNVGRR